MQFIECGKFFVAEDAGNSYGSAAIYLNSGHPATGGPQAEGVWHKKDLKPLGVPADAVAVLLTGIELITMSGASEVADLHFAARKPGNIKVTPNYYLGQTACVVAAGGSRSNHTFVVPLVNGELEYAFQLGPNVQQSPVYPAGAAYGFTFCVQGYWGPPGI